MRTFLFLLLTSLTATAQFPQPDGGNLRAGTLPAAWITGGRHCLETPKWQVHEYNPDLFIIRESGCVNYEKPFLYLLFGSTRALLIDTGAGETDVARIITDVAAGWMLRNHKSALALVVAHSHSHDDHHSGDSQLAELGHHITTMLIPLTLTGTQQAFGIEHWPEQVGSIRLDERVIDTIAIPGHDKLGVAFYDRQTGVLFTGDTLYPGRLYIPDFAAYASSVARLVRFTEGKAVAHILGCHIEQSDTPFFDYPIGSSYQPHEHELALSRAHLLELHESVQSMRDRPVRLALRDFTIYPTNDEVWKELDRVSQATQEQSRKTMSGQPQ